MKKAARYVLAILAIGFLAHNSVYFKPLDEVKSSAENKRFDPASYAKTLLESQMKKVMAIPVSDFYGRLDSDFDALMESEGKKLGVSDLRYFMIKGEGMVLTIEEENVVLQLEAVPNQTLRIATDFIFGNTLRDASGLVSISDYANTMDFNNISEEINKQVQQEVVSPFVKKVREGSRIKFQGGTKIHIKDPALDDLRVIPTELEIL